MLALALVDRIPLPGPVARLALEIGRSSMYLYLAHPIVISLLVAAAPAGRALHFVLAYAISYAIARSLVALADRQSRLRSHLARLGISAIRRRAPTGA